VEAADSKLTIAGKEYKVLNEQDPAKLPWKDLGVDLVFECSGVFTQREDLQKHLQAGAKRVILSAPAKSDDIKTIVSGVNAGEETDEIISCASCTTNCITPVVEIINRRIGIKKANMTTIHAYTSSQSLVDGPDKKVRRGRAAAANFVPTSTGAAKATAKALPEMEGKFDGAAVRGPVAVGSLADMNMVTERETTVEEINDILREEAQSERYKGILGATDDELVSSDIIQDARASIVDLKMTQVVGGDLVKIMSWYDNEWGYASQMVRAAQHVASKVMPS
jgi:glyceraldehyde 3-phosphate dehydrogenase